MNRGPIKRLLLSKDGGKIEFGGPTEHQDMEGPLKRFLLVHGK